VGLELLAGDRALPFLLTTPTCLAAEAMVGSATLEQFLASPIAALGQTVGVDVFEWRIIEFDPFS